MLNTNPSFDYGAFRALAAKVNANSSTVSAFAFSFTEAGTYVFGNSLNAAAQTIVVVMKAGTTCPTEAPIVPLNEKNLITVSAKRRTDDLILAPDWALIIGLLSGLLGVVVAVIAGLYYFRTKSWTNTAVKSISGYRAKSKQVNLAAMHSKGTVAVTNEADVDGGASSSLLSTGQTTAGMKQLQLGGEGPHKGDKMEYKADLGRWDEEDLDLRELVDRLQFHHEAVTKNFEDQKGDVKQLMQHLQAEAIEVKRLFVGALVSSNLSMTSEAKREESNSAPQDVEDEMIGLLPMSTLSGRPRTRSIASKEKFLLENLERDLQERNQFEQKKSAMIDGVSAGLREVEEWGAQFADLASALVQEMSLPVNDGAPERTTTSEEATSLERTRMVLGDLKTMLGSDPMSQTSSSLIHLTEAEKGRREVGNFVLEASQRYFVPHSTPTSSRVEDLTGTENVIQRLLGLHNDVEKAQNKEDEASLGPLLSLQKFGAVLPQVLATLDDLETNFRHELDAVREQQNPVKLRAVQAQMQSRLSKLLKEVAAGAKKVNEKLEKEAPRALKVHRGALQAEGALTLALAAAKDQSRQADQDQRDRVAATNLRAMEDASLATPLPLPSPVETDDSVKSSDDTLFQIKELLVELATMMRTRGASSTLLPEQQTAAAVGNTPVTLVDTRVLHAAGVKRNIESSTKHNADAYASALDAKYPQLSTVEKERLLDDFASDLRKIQSSVSVDATRTQADIATRQTATEVLRDTHKAQVQHREQEDAGVLRAQHEEEEQSLESQFRQEELAIEQEYLKELSSLEMEFGDTSVENDGDFAEPHEDIEIEDDDGNSPEEKLEDELAAFAKQAVEQLKGKHLHLQRKVEERKALATVAVAVSNAQIQYLDGLNSDGDSFFISTKTEPSIETTHEQLDITGELLGALANQIPAQIEQQTQQELDKLRAEYMAACNKRRVELEADAAARRSRLAEKMSRRRLEKQNENPTQEATTRVVGCTIEAIDEQEHVALAEINEELKTALEELDESERQTVKVIGQALSSSLHKSGKEVEGFLRQCQQKHELALSKLEPGDKSKGQVQTVLNALNALEVEMSEREQVAAQARGAIEREIDRLNEESSIASVALSQSLEAEKRRQEQRLHQRMAQRRELQRSQLPPGSSPEEVAEMNDIISKQETVEKQRLEDQLDTQAQLAFVEERAKQRENEDRLSQQLRDASVVEATVSATKEALVQVRDEYASGGVSSDEELAPQLRLWETRIPRNVSMISATDMSARKRSMIARLAAQVVSAVLPANSSITGVENVVGETMAAEMERQIRALSANHHFAWQQRRQELQEDEARRKTELERRLLYKREAKHRVGGNAETAGQPHEEKYESEVELHQQLEAAVIERKFAMEAELESELEQLAAAIQSAGTQSTADIEALLAACHSNFVTETAALCNALQVQRQAQQEALRQRLLRKRQENLQELGSSGNATDLIALAALECDLKQEEATALHTFAEEETRQLSVLHDRLRNEVGEAFAEADRKAKTRCDETSSRLADRESELSNIYRDHEESKRALHEALEVERRRQQNKLLERTARRRAERLAELKRENPNGLSEEVEHRALGLLESDYEHERLRLDAVLNEQDNLAQREHDDKIRAKEEALQLETRRLRGEAEAAQAAREALIAAHCAEADRVTREFYACLEGTVDIKALKARDHRRRLEERLAAKCTPKGCSDLSPKTDESYTATSAKDVAPPKETIPAGFKDAVVDELERELQNLHAQHDRDWESLKTRLKEETRLRKAQLQDRLKRKRQVLQNTTTMPPTERAHAEAVLDREEERENLAIDMSAGSAARVLELTAQHAREQAADKLTEGFIESSDDVEALLMSTRQRHVEAQRHLRETLEMERQKQELLLKERLQQRRAAKGERAILEAEKDEEANLHQQLSKKLTEQETQEWATLSELQQQEVDAVLAPLQVEVVQRHNAAAIGEREAREQLERLTAERDHNLAELRNSLEAEKQRQQLALRGKLQRKRDQRKANGTAVSAEEEHEQERQAFEALEISVEASVASVEDEVLDAYRERETELLAQVCAYSAYSAAQEAALTVLDAARLQAERVRAEYDAALTEKLRGEAAERAVGRDEIARRLAEQKQKRYLQRQLQRHRNEVTGNDEGATNRGPIIHQSKELVVDDSIDREIVIVQAAHARGVEARREQLEADIAARKASLAARLEHKRRAAVIASGDPKIVPKEVEKALQLEEQEELAAIERSRTAKLAELETEAAQEQEHLSRALREADKRGAADIEQQLAACKLAHEAELAKLDEALRAERARQELALKQRLAAKRYRHKTAAADTKDGESHEVDESYDVIQKEMERQEHEARKQLVGRQQQELADVVRKLEDETEAQRKAATDLQVAAERELKRLEEEHARERRTLQDALLTDQRQREAQLREKLAKKKAARQTKGTQAQQDSDSDVEADVAMAALQEQLKLEQAAATTQERQKQEAALRQAEAKLQVAAKSAAEAVAAARQAQEESVRVTADFDRHRGETQQLQATQSAHSKRKLADRLAEKKQKQKLKKQQSEKVSGESIAEQNTTTSELEEVERLRLEAKIEAQLAACREAHDAESTKLRESLRIERERQEHALQERIARRKEKRSKAEAHAITKGDVKTAEEAELKQEEEDEEVALATALAAQEKQAWEAIQRKQDEDLRALQEIKQQQERERAEHQKQLAEQEMNRLQQEHERELRTLEASLSLEQARQEEKLQQRIAQRRAKKQRQEEEAAANSAKLQQATADAEEESRDAAAREKTKALAEAQAQAEAEAEEIERQEIAIRLAHKLEEERARQQRETQELTARLAREAEVQAAKHAEALALQLQQEAAETADKLAREFDINLRELRDSHSADGAAQKARLESRIAVKKARKLRELEEKRELERQRLHARQQQEADEAANAEKEREAALEEAVSQAAIPIIEQEDVISLPAIPAVLSPAEETTDDLMRAALQQQHDVTAVQQLFTYGLVPQKLSLLGAVELVVVGRHERELMALLTGLTTRSSENVRRTLEIVMQQKATRKAQALQEIMTRCSSTIETKDNPKVKEETERELDQLDREFTDKLREAEQIAIVENEEVQAQTEKHLKERQMREVAYLLAHFDAQHTAALANVVPLQQPQQFQSVLSAPQREADDLEVELRARLELEADDRRRALDEEKRQELERLSREEQTQIAKVEDHLAASLAEEQAALTKLLSTRVKALPDRKSKQREALEREHAAQLQRLTLMLEGRGTQHKVRVRARMAQQKLLIEDEFRRKAQVIIAVMNQRLVQEKAELRQKQNLLAPVIATPTVNDPQDHRQETGSAQLMLAADLAKRLEDVLEERLAKIEALVTAYNSPEQTTSTQDKIDAHQSNPDEKDNASAIAYRWAVAEAVAVGCRYEKPLIMDAETSLASSLFGVLDVKELDTSGLERVPVNQLDERMRVRCQFAELLLHAVASKHEDAPALEIVDSFGHGKKSGADYASFSPAKAKAKENEGGGCGTLYLSLAALQKLSTGQLAVVILHALAQVRAHTSDLTEPQFISHLYAVLIQCYQGLFTRVQEQTHLPVDSTQNQTNKLRADKTRKSMNGNETKPTGTRHNEEGGQWQTRLHEMEMFLTRLGDHQAATPSLQAMQRSQGSRSRLLEKPREADNVGRTIETTPNLVADPWQHELQLLQEKLDTAEKLYLKVLRQHEQQTQTLEYWQDLLAELRGAEYDKDAFDEEEEEVDGGKPREEDTSTIERQRERDARAQEAQTELDRATYALEVTRVERDELFGQCQQLRDQLTLLREGHKQ
ncbi:hypothetical protein BBJ29_001231 [Phytophthora kernoviae]|uniref:Transmembrane protein n=1 Tax=Phytophthora kernoviae TaxID=325452 RepID=A0A421FU47_9STRA|nr:hypothetical protein BBJ29_001231 [Phytophthora kernoviae]